MVVEVLRALVLIAVVAGVLFGLAGRWDLPFFWAFLGVGGIIAVISNLSANPELVQERIHETWAGENGLLPGSLILGPIFMFGPFVIAALDVGHYHWSDTLPINISATQDAVGSSSGSSVPPLRLTHGGLWLRSYPLLSFSCAASL